jgi:ATP-dependent Zn protease
MAKNLLLWMVIAAVLLTVFNNINQEPVTSQVNYSDFIREVRSGQVTSVNIAGVTVNGVRSDNTRFNTTIPMIGDDQLMDDLFNNGVEIRAERVNIADEIKGSLINLTIGETYTFYCESPSKQFLSDTMNLIYEIEQELTADPNFRELTADQNFGEISADQNFRELTARPNTRWRLEKQDLAEQNRAYLCTEGKVIQ